ncbi:hypothetical protein GY45DRAFT_1439438 [Cubamyces sp. BRFM 1775]|nr:hypothetical protein GY45DRAFT_1439438 [Cubamyces sp. BRFM 1775]
MFFSDLPIELQIQIILLLDVGLIISCRSACRHMCAIIDDSVAVQYRLELCAAGMVDGTYTPGLSISDRLNSLREYEKAWLSAPFTYHPLLRAAVNDPDHCEDWWPTTGGTIPYTSKGALRLFRPPSLSRGVVGKTWCFPSTVVEVEDAVEICIDPEQDLMVLPKWSEGQGGRVLKCHLLSIELKGTPHPMATQPLLCSGPHRLASASSSSRVHILGDLLGCTVDSDRCMMVFNWKTGHVVWRFHSSGAPRFHLLDSYTLVLFERYSIRLYIFDPAVTEDIPCDSQPDEHCVLALPPLVESNPILSCDEAHLTPTAYADCGPIFFPSPSSSFLVVTYHIYSIHTTLAFRAAGHRHPTKWTHLLMLIPIRTLLNQSVRASQRPDTCLDSTPIISWDDWGPHGTRCLLLDNDPKDISAIGSKCVLYFPRYGSDGGMADILIIDARPWVHLAPSYRKYHNISAPYLLKPSTYDKCQLFASPLHSTLPYRVLHREIRLGSDLSSASTMLLEDGLAISRSLRSYPQPGDAPEDGHWPMDVGFDILLT